MVASSNVETTLQTIEYNPPQLNELIVRAKKNLRSNYKNNKPARLALISLLENLADRIYKYVSLGHESAIPDLYDVYLGAWVYCMESIANEYRLFNPAHKEGYLFNSGSTLYEILLTNLCITKNHQITEKTKLYYLCKFYHFLFQSTYPSELFIANTQLPHIKEELIKMMRAIVMSEREEQTRLLTAIPSEKSITEGMSQLFQQYIGTSKHKNPKRMMLAKLAVAITHSKASCPTDSTDSLQIIPRSARVKIGMLIYIMETIKNSYPLRSPENSLLYSLCEKILGNSYNHLSNEIKLSCLLAFELHLNNEKNRELLEIEFNKSLLDEGISRPMYLDLIIRPISINLSKMITKFAPNDSMLPFSKVTLTASALGAMIMAAPGYGAGYAVGYGVSLTDQLGSRKRTISRSTGYAMQVALGMSSCYYGYYAADIFLTAGLERMFAKIFETLAIIIGGTSAGAMSFIIYDLSFTTALALCRLCLHLNKNIPSDRVQPADLLFIKTLLELPPEVFSDTNKDTLRKITDLPLSTSDFGLLSYKNQTTPPKTAPEQEAPVLMLKN